MNQFRTPTQGFWQRLLWELVFPERLNRAEPTMSGLVLIGLSFGVGLAAYNSSNNILFIALSLLLASLLLSGVLSWLNLRSIQTELLSCGPCRCGEAAAVQVLARNPGGQLPSYGLWCDLVAEPSVPAVPVSAAAPRAVAPEPRAARRLRARLSSVGALVFRGRIHLGRGLPAGGEAQMTWAWTPSRRGAWDLRLAGVGSLFPFGFLLKQKAQRGFRRVVVRPAALRYEAQPPEPAPRAGSAGRRSRRGSGSDLLSLRRYAAGDPHSLIHWKASARLGRLLVRETSEEAGSPFALSFDPDPRLWPDPAQFERGVALAAALAEDLHRQGRLSAVQLGRSAWQRIRGEADLGLWLDHLSCVTQAAREDAPGARAGLSVPVITFKPQGPNGAAAHVEGRLIAVA